MLDQQLSPGAELMPPESVGSGECPLRRVLAVNVNGLVLESMREFEFGATLVLGCHVTQCQDRGSVFLSAEVVVVESRPADSGARLRAATGKPPVYQVTVLFSEIAREDLQRLMALPCVDAIRLSRSRSGLAIPPPVVFSPSPSSAGSLVEKAGAGSGDRLPDDQRSLDGPVGTWRDGLANGGRCSLN